MPDATPANRLKQDVLLAQERLRQVQLTFDARKKQDNAWFLVRYAMAWTTLAVVVAIAYFCADIIKNYKSYSEPVVKSAIGALFVDLIGLFIHTWHLVFKQQKSSQLEPFLKLLIEQDQSKQVKVKRPNLAEEQ